MDFPLLPGSLLEVILVQDEGRAKRQAVVAGGPASRTGELLFFEPPFEASEPPLERSVIAA